MKYVIFVNELTGLESAILFDESVRHSIFLNLKPVSAGFVTFEGDQINTYGRSTSLNLDPREQDQRLIRRAVILKTTLFMTASQ